MYICLDKNFYNKNIKKASEAAIEEMGTDMANFAIFDPKGESVDDASIEGDNLSITITNELGTFGFDIPIDSVMLEDIISFAIKKMNKIKTLIESLK